MTKRSYGDGGIDQRGENSFRLRYRVGKQRYSVTFKRTFAEARAELRRLLRTIDTKSHVAPDANRLRNRVLRNDRGPAQNRRSRDYGRSAGDVDD